MTKENKKKIKEERKTWKSDLNLIRSIEDVTMFTLSYWIFINLKKDKRYIDLCINDNSAEWCQYVSR